MDVLTLHDESIIKMLLDDEFYEFCPYFVWLQDTLKLYEEESKKPKNAFSRIIQTAFQGSVTLLADNIKKLQALNPEYVECIKDYIEKKRNTRPKEILLQYKKIDGVTTKLRF